MYELINRKVFTGKFVGTGPSSYEIRIYRAAVSQRLRNTGLEYADSSSSSWISHGTFSQVLDSLRVSRMMVFLFISASMLEEPERWVGRSGLIPWLANSLDFVQLRFYTGLSKKMDGIWNRYNLKSTGRIYTFGVLKCSEKFKVLDLP